MRFSLSLTPGSSPDRLAVEGLLKQGRSGEPNPVAPMRFEFNAPTHITWPVLNEQVGARCSAIPKARIAMIILAIPLTGPPRMRGAHSRACSRIIITDRLTRLLGQHMLHAMWAPTAQPGFQDEGLLRVVMKVISRCVSDPHP